MVILREDTTLSSEIVEKIKCNGKKVEHGDFVYYTLSDPQQMLSTLVNHGFILHGSSRKIEGRLLPHQAYDEAKKFGNQKAIYLTSDPLQAMFTALTGGVNEIKFRKNSIRSIRDEKGDFRYKDTYFAVSNLREVKSNGYVYVFSTDVIDDSENFEYIAKKPIKPELIIQIKRDDFPCEIEKLEK